MSDTKERPDEVGWYSFTHRGTDGARFCGYWSGKFFYVGCNRPIGYASQSIGEMCDFVHLVPASPCPACLNWSKQHAKVLDELVAVKAERDEFRESLVNTRAEAFALIDVWRDKQTEIDSLKARLAEVEQQLENRLVSMMEARLEIAQLRPAKESAEARVKELEAQLPKPESVCDECGCRSSVNAHFFNCSKLPLKDQPNERD